MNRAMRRAAARAKPIEFQRVPLPALLDEFTVFDDLDRMLQKLHNGEIEYADGRPVMMCSDGSWYEVVPALNGWISAWKNFNQKFQLGMELGPMVRLCNCLNYGSPLTTRQIEAARTLLAQQRRAFRNIPREEIASAAKTEQIRLLMETH